MGQLTVHHVPDPKSLLDLGSWGCPLGQRPPSVSRTTAAVGTTAFTCFNSAWGGGAFTSCLPLHSASWGPGCSGLLYSSHYLGPCVQSSSITPETAPPLLGTIQMAFLKLPRFQDCPGPCFQDSLYCCCFLVVY